jgi:hypothetical protein
MSQTPCRDVGSNPEDGSSRNIIFDFPIKELANDNLRLFPPERFFTNFPFSLVKAHFSIIYSTL